MDKDSLVRKYAHTAEEKLLLSRACDQIRLSNKKWEYCFSEFLSPSEQTYLENIFELREESQINFYGGYETAERRILATFPRELSEPDLTFIPIDIIQIEARSAEMTHRDILGSLMGLQIKRNRIGDILDKHNPPLFICHRDITAYILQNLEKIGRNKVKISYGEIANLPEQIFETKTATVSSLRLDSMVGEAFNISRTKAAEKIRTGLVRVNWTTTDNASMSLNVGDKFSLQGKGKAKLQEIGGLSKKGRIYVKIQIYK